MISLNDYNYSVFLKNKDLINAGCEYTYDYANEKTDDSNYYTHCLEIIIQTTPFLDYTSTVFSVFKNRSINGLNILYRYKPSLFYENKELIETAFEFIYENKELIDTESENKNLAFIDWLIEKKVVFSSNILYRSILFKNYYLANRLVDIFINDNKTIIKTIEKDLNEGNTDFTFYVINKPDISRHVIEWYIYYVIKHWSNETLVKSLDSINLKDIDLKDKGFLSRLAIHSINTNKPKVMSWLKNYDAFNYIKRDDWFDIFINLISKRKIGPIKWFFMNNYKINFTDSECRVIIQKSVQYLKNKHFTCVVYFLHKICKYTKNDPFVKKVLEDLSRK